MTKFDPPPLFQPHVQKNLDPPTSSVDPPTYKKSRPPHLHFDNSNTAHSYLKWPDRPPWHPCYMPPLPGGASQQPKKEIGWKGIGGGGGGGVFLRSQVWLLVIGVGGWSE